MFQFYGENLFIWADRYKTKHPLTNYLETKNCDLKNPELMTDKGIINEKDLLPISVRFMTYSKCSNWCGILKFLLNFGCLFTFCYLDGANSIKTDLHICNIWTGQFVSYKSVN